MAAVRFRQTYKRDQAKWDAAIKEIDDAIREGGPDDTDNLPELPDPDHNTGTVFGPGSPERQPPR